MKSVCLQATTLAFLFVGSSLADSPFADSLVSFSAGTGATASLNDPSAALGEPSRITPDPFGGPVDPLNPPFKVTQVVSVGAGGSLTVGFNAAIQNHPAHLFGIDFLVFGNNGFTITNGDFSGGGITDGSLFTFDPPGSSRVLVSTDNVNYFLLVPPTGVAGSVDALFPTDGTGSFHVPVNPTLGNADFSGRDLPGIRSLYAGSGGGTGFDLDWARDRQGNPVPIDSVNYVRIEVVSGKVEIDGIAAVPEPSTMLLVPGGGAVALAAGLRTRRNRRR